MYVYAYIQLVVLFVKGADEIVYQESTVHVFFTEGRMGWCTFWGFCLVFF